MIAPVHLMSDVPFQLSVYETASAGEAADVAWLEEHIISAVRRLGVENGSLNVVVVDDEEMARLHEQFRGEAGTTDVLTFDMKGQGADRGLEGEIYICRDEARRVAAGLGHGVREELLLYAIHGVLHLLGYDDHDEEAYRKMHEKEDEVLSALGVGRVFSRAQAVRAETGARR